MKRLDRIRSWAEDGFAEQAQRVEVTKAERHYGDYFRIRAGYLRSRVEGDTIAFDQLMDAAEPVLEAFGAPSNPEGLLRAAAASVVWERTEDVPPELWRPAWSEMFDRAGDTLRHDDLAPDKASMLWRVAHLRTFGALTSIDRFAGAVRPTVRTVPFYIFVNVPVEEVLSIASGCVDAYTTVVDEADSWIDPSP
ncbi:MAG TPA: hypothetical protein VLA29_05340 [Acidimicrobiia bacterium]|nr:hypothetical protein [Acidimicrobiia bacterium]